MQDGRVLKALSVRAPWWWFVLHAGKDIENRDWATKFRGTIYLHVGKWWREAEIKDDWGFAEAECIDAARNTPCVTLGSLRGACGCLVGKVDVVDCVERSSSRWFFGPYGIVLRNPVAFARPIPCKGALGFFDVPEVIAREAESCGVMGSRHGDEGERV